MTKVMVDIDKRFYEWWTHRWPQHIKEDETMMIVAEAAWVAARKEPKEEVMKDIYKMGLHDIVEIKSIAIMRVPGGWLYITPSGGIIRVPFNNEFQAIEKERE